MQRLWISVLLIFFFSPAALAAGVYKWVDEQGKVHYGDRPGNSNASKIAVPVSPPSSSNNLNERNAMRDKLIRTMEEERKLKEEDSHKAKLKDAERKQRCIEAQDKLRRYQESQYIYKPAEGGERIIFSEEERKQATDDAQKAVQEWCG